MPSLGQLISQEFWINVRAQSLISQLSWLESLIVIGRSRMLGVAVGEKMAISVWHEETLVESVRLLQSLISDRSLQYEKI